MIITVTCESLIIANGQVIYNASGVTNADVEFYYVDTMASFSCNPGYSLSGSDTSIYQDSGGGTWNQQTPTCIQGDKMITSFCCFIVFYLDVQHKTNFSTKIFTKWSNKLKQINHNYSHFVWHILFNSRYCDVSKYISSKQWIQDTDFFLSLMESIYTLAIKTKWN